MRKPAPATALSPPPDSAHRLSITVCGDGGCGKSSITLRLVRSQWTHEYDPTIEDSYSVTRTIDGATYNLLLTDTAGQEEYRGLWSTASLHSDAFLLVYDITAPRSLDALNHFDQLLALEREARADADAAPARPPPVCIVVGNKSDLNNVRAIDSRVGWDWARARGYGFMETSARDMVNIEETFALLVRRVVAARRQHSGPDVDPSASAPLLSSIPRHPVADAGPNEKSSPAEPASSYPPRKLTFWHRLKCW